mgnify:CR=1 FL=1
MKNISKKIILFLNDGLPKGIREVSIDQWSGGALCGPRNKIDDIIKFKELDSPCVYFLIGELEEGELLNIYVGEADSFNQRVKDHLRKKDWWQHVVVFFGSNNNPSKTGIEYLESHIYVELKKAARCILENGNAPALPNIQKHDIPGLLTFYENICLIMPVLGFDIFAPLITGEEIKNNKFIFCEGKGAKAKALLLDDGKVRVLKGSTAINDNAPSFEKHNYKKLKDELLKIGRLIINEEHLSFTEDYVFDSLSSAAAVILARSAQGPKEWRYQSGISVKDSIE